MHEIAVNVNCSRKITVCDKRSVFFIKFEGGEYLVEKFVPNADSKYELYNQERTYSYKQNSEGIFYKISLEVPPDVVFFQIENNKLREVLVKCNTFCHIKSVLNIELYLAEAIVRIENPELYRTMQDNSICAEAARAKYEQRILELASTN